MRLCVMLLLCCLLPGMVGAAQLERVRLGVHEASTRVVIETTRSLAAEIARPTADRLELTIRAALGPAPSIATPRGFVRAIVAEPLGGGRTRLHLTLDGPGRVARAFALDRNADGFYRYVIDVEPDPAAGPPAAAPPVQRTTEVQAPRRPPLRRADAARAAPAPPSRPVVVIDPGHGGVDPGAIAPSGLLEKDVVLDVGHRLRERLAADGRLDVVMTREGDQALTLARRIDLAAEARADLLVSLHADSLPQTPSLAGASVYTLSQQPSDPEAARRAQSENAADERLEMITTQTDETVRTILTSIMRTSTTQRSVRAADDVATELRRVTPMLGRERRSANFVVLRSLHTPSVLVELGYLSNPEDEARLTDPAHRDRLAEALFRSVTGYFDLK
ncbi:MAG: N-acetylmuramoyl-L-alanine amidase family protein [Pseudomonadota bacterium]